MLVQSKPLCQTKGGIINARAEITIQELMEGKLCRPRGKDKLERLIRAAETKMSLALHNVEQTGTEISTYKCFTSCKFEFCLCALTMLNQLQIVLYKSLVQLAWDSTLGDKPSHNLANMRTESITRPCHLIPVPSAASSEQ